MGGLGVLWFPEVFHYHLDRSSVPIHVIDRHESAPMDAVLDEVFQCGPDIEFWLRASSRPLATTAEQISQGLFVSDNFPAAILNEEPYPADFIQRLPILQLAIAGFAVERVLLSAYARTGNLRYLQLAESRIVAFAAYERKQRWVRSTHWMLWNDHAIAARVGVLVLFWKHYRARLDSRPAVKEAVLSLANRSGQLLAKPAHFNAGSNHGVIQNVGLLQLSAAFPHLPDARAWRETAVERLLLQLPYYVSVEGFVIDHSSGYHVYGLELLTKAARLLMLQGQEVPAPLLQAVAKARKILEVLRRPDGSLPVIGDTSMTLGLGIPVLSLSGPITYVHPDSAPITSLLLPVSGYSIWWSGTALEADLSSQVVVAWSKFDGIAHKHADEPSVHFWRDGVHWITATGYWPYGVEGFQKSSGWDGSNAPHLVGEASDSRRTAVARASAASSENRLRFVEAVRTGPAGLQVARQVVYFDDALIVLDFVNAPSNTRVKTIWTIDPRAGLLNGGDGRLQAYGPAGSESLLIRFLGFPDVKPAIVRGSREPFAGWVVRDGVPVPANALMIEQPGGLSMAASVFLPFSGKMRASALDVSMQPEPKSEQWSVVIQGSDRTYRITRAGNALRGSVEVATVELAESRAVLTPLPDTVAEIKTMRNARLAALERYPRRKDLVNYRERVTVILLAGAVALESVLALSMAVSSRARERNWLSFSVAIAVGWGLLAVLCNLFYLRSS